MQFNIKALDSPKGKISHKENCQTELSDTKSTNLAELLGRNRLHSTRNINKPSKFNPFSPTTPNSNKTLSNRDNSIGAGDDYSLSTRL